MPLSGKVDDLNGDKLPPAWSEDAIEASSASDVLGSFDLA
jgi:hypothetical protein